MSRTLGGHLQEVTLARVLTRPGCDSAKSGHHQEVAVSGPSSLTAPHSSYSQLVQWASGPAWWRPGSAGHPSENIYRSTAAAAVAAGAEVGVERIRGNSKVGASSSSSCEGSSRSSSEGSSSSGSAEVVVELAVVAVDSSNSPLQQP